MVLSNLRPRNLTAVAGCPQRGGRGVQIAEDTVRTRLRALFDAGVLPRQIPRQMVAGRSEVVARCVASDVSFRLGDIEYEVDIGEAPMPLVHRRCLELWAEAVLNGNC